MSRTHLRAANNVLLANKSRVALTNKDIGTVTHTDTDTDTPADIGICTKLGPDTEKYAHALPRAVLPPLQANSKTHSEFRHLHLRRRRT